jgi:hypothetical protein
VTPVRGDVANVLDLLYATIKTAAKRLDIVVANAGRSTDRVGCRLVPVGNSTTFGWAVVGHINCGAAGRAEFPRPEVWEPSGSTGAARQQCRFGLNV